ncbi:MAG: hypothetical protein A2150_00620 [Candidatus Muproteobacteria bacterium RBG_16_64_11]|uniref:RDD domain-containing protein n=1 Tax=Candidatus Muproteobacteria bacterium RBG_16_64_11 TaxID=1817758 RepID=A0A1F6T924_9PROT|nr:MAG: hypothetical protein A2150_00620 [Candidatus Muproteobacteria bacterium RBG_16_64_11]
MLPTDAPPGLPRRLAAMAYDGLLLVGLWMIAGLPFVWLATRQDLVAPGGMRLVFQGYLLLIGFADGIEARAAGQGRPVCGFADGIEARAAGQGWPVCGFLFYGWFWTRGGQTLGMRAWRLRLTRADGGPVTWRRAALRIGALGARPARPRAVVGIVRQGQTRLARPAVRHTPDRNAKSNVK